MQFCKGFVLVFETVSKLKNNVSQFEIMQFSNKQLFWTPVYCIYVAQSSILQPLCSQKHLEIAQCCFERNQLRPHCAALTQIRDLCHPQMGFVLSCQSSQFSMGVLVHLPVSQGYGLVPFFGSNRQFSSSCDTNKKGM